METRDNEDNMLMEQVRQGNVKAFETLYRRYWSPLYAQAYKRLKSKESTEELVQDFFTDLWAKRQGIDIHTSVSNYFRTAVKYQVFHHLQREVVRSRYLRYMSDQPDIGHHSTDELVALHELESAVEQRVATLSPKSKLVYQLSREKYLTIPEIARQLDISEKTAENHLGRALKVLKSGLKYLVTTLILVLSQKFF